jgi:hypothetical protein
MAASDGPAPGLGPKRRTTRRPSGRRAAAANRPSPAVTAHALRFFDVSIASS